MDRYQPEMGQALFGQPSQKFEASEMMLAALESIRYELDRVMGNIHQEEYENPFGNTGQSYKNDTFEAVAYDWDDNADQTYNFKFGTIRVSWYKYLGRGMSVNGEVSNDEIANMLYQCLVSLRKYEEEMDPEP